MITERFIYLLFDKEKERKLRLAAEDKLREAVSTPTYVGFWSLDSSLWHSYENFYRKVNRIEINQLENFVNQVLTIIKKIREEEERKNQGQREEYSRKAQGFPENPTKNPLKTTPLDELYEEEENSLEEEINELKNNPSLPNDPELEEKLRKK